MTKRLPAILLSFAILASCTGGDEERSVEAYDGIAESETVHLLGTEPFWGAEISGDTLTYTTPENMDGSVTQVERFAGNNGLGYSGTLDGQTLQIAVTPGECSDGMSDRTYPFTATVTIGENTLLGCGYSDNTPLTGQENP